MNATVSFLPSAPHLAPRTAGHGTTAADSDADGEGTGSPPDAAATGAARPFSTWMREQQQQQQLQERRRLGGGGAPGAATPTTGLPRGGKTPSVTADVDTGGGTKPRDSTSGPGVSMALVDPIVCETPAGGLAALLGTLPQPGDATASARTDDPLAGSAARDRVGGSPSPGALPGPGDRATGRLGESGRREVGGADAASAAPRAGADGVPADGLLSSAAAHGTAEARRDHGAGLSRGTSGGHRPDHAATGVPTSLDAARLVDGRRDAPAGSTPPSPSTATTAALGAAAAFALPTDTVRTDAVPAGAPVLDLAAPVDAAEFAPALGAQVAVLARDGVQRAELNLHPADMGPVSIDISIVGTTAHVDFGADVAATRAAIESGLADLAAALHEAGFTLAGGGVSARARERDGSEAEHQAGDGGRRVTAGGGRQGPGAVDGGDSGSVTRRTVQLRQGAVDLYA
jgi:flagellar hook-length control protein FliK